MTDNIVYGKLICKYSWVCALRQEDLYVFVIQTARNNLVEFKKFCYGMKSLYNSVNVGDEVKVRFDTDCFSKPLAEYSTSFGQVYGPWEMTYTEESCTKFKVNARRSIKSWWMHDQPGHMIGRYVGHRENTEATRGSFVSYYVTFLDMHDTRFVCQFWCNERLEEFLPNVKFGDKILILNARILPEDRYEDTTVCPYRLVTCYAPVQAFGHLL